MNRKEAYKQVSQQLKDARLRNAMGHSQLGEKLTPGPGGYQLPLPHPASPGCTQDKVSAC